jgi:polyferredoxin
MTVKKKRLSESTKTKPKKPRKDPIPLGMKLIFLLSIFGLLSALPGFTQTNPLNYTPFFGIPLASGLYNIKLLLIAAISLITIISIIKRYTWGWSFYIISSVLYLLDSALSYKYFLSFQSAQNNNTLIIIYIITMLIFGVLPTYYIYKNKSYFNKK